MPAKGKSKVSDRQRQAIAAAKVAGKPTKAIAKALELHPDTVKKVASDVRTTTLILRLKEKNDQAFGKMWQDMMRELAKDVKAKDYSERQGARIFLLRAITAGDPPLHRVGDVGSADGDFTLDELLSTMRTIRKGA
jgi:transposase